MMSIRKLCSLGSFDAATDREGWCGVRHASKSAREQTKELVGRCSTRMPRFLEKSGEWDKSTGACGMLAGRPKRRFRNRRPGKHRGRQSLQNGRPVRHTETPMRRAEPEKTRGVPKAKADGLMKVPPTSIEDHPNSAWLPKPRRAGGWPSSPWRRT